MMKMLFVIAMIIMAILVAIGFVTVVVLLWTHFDDNNLRDNK